MRESLKEKEQPISDLHNEKVVSSSALLIGTYESHDRTSLFFLNAFFADSRNRRANFSTGLVLFCNTSINLRELEFKNE